MKIMKRTSVISRSLLSAGVAMSAIALTPQALRADVDPGSDSSRFSSISTSSSQSASTLETSTSGQAKDSALVVGHTATDLLDQPNATITRPSEVPTAVPSAETSPITFTPLPKFAAAAAVSAAPISNAAPIPNASVPAAQDAPTTATTFSELPRLMPIESQIAQSEPLLVENEETRYRLGYVGVGANLGLTGDGALSDEGFAVFSKIPLSSNLSLRPSLIFTGDVGILLPVTYDFQIGSSDLPRAMPYLGTGISISTGDDSEVDFLLTGGVDIPLSRQFTATAGLNVAPFNSFDLGVLLGVAYNFEARTVRTAIASVNPEFFGQDARSNPSFLGAGLNLGIGGDSALGDSSFAVLSKVALGPDLSVRPTLLIENDVTFLIPVTYDFQRIDTEYLTLAPYAGGGLSFSTGDDSNVDLLLSAGFDIPITRNLAATTGINITPFDSFDIGVQAGLVLTFGSY